MFSHGLTYLLSHNAPRSAMFPNARWRFPGEHRDAPLTRSITMQIERLLVSKKELKTIGIPYSPQHIARLEKAKRFPQRITAWPVPGRLVLQGDLRVDRRAYRPPRFS